MLTTLARGVSTDDYLHLPESGARRHLVDGDLLEEPAAEDDHYQISMFLYRALWAQIESPGLGRVWGQPMDVWLDQETSVQPDVFAVSETNQRVKVRRWVYGPPDLVVEVQSPSTARFVLGRKRQLYAAAGVREMWVIDARRRRAEIHLFNDSPPYPIKALDERDLFTSLSFPEVSIPVGSVFAAFKTTPPRGRSARGAARFKAL